MAGTRKARLGSHLTIPADAPLPPLHQKLTLITVIIKVVKLVVQIGYLMPAFMHLFDLQRHFSARCRQVWTETVFVFVHEQIKVHPPRT